MGPGAVFEHIMKNPPPIKETGPTRAERRNARSRDTPQEETDYGFKAKAINPAVHGEGPAAQ
jgi:hypothetical protein